MKSPRETYVITCRNAFHSSVASFLCGTEEKTWDLVDHYC